MEISPSAPLQHTRFQLSCPVLQVLGGPPMLYFSVPSPPNPALAGPFSLLHEPAMLFLICTRGSLPRKLPPLPLLFLMTSALFDPIFSVSSSIDVQETRLVLPHICTHICATLDRIFLVLTYHKLFCVGCYF